MTNAGSGPRTLSILQRAQFAVRGTLFAALDRRLICERIASFELILPGT